MSEPIDLSTLETTSNVPTLVCVLNEANQNIMLGKLLDSDLDAHFAVASIDPSDPDHELDVPVNFPVQTFHYQVLS